MWDLKIDTRRLADGFSTSVLWDRPNVLWNKADDWWNDNYVTDSNTAAFLSATGIIDPNKQNYVNNLVIALKNQGLWNKMKAVYPFVSEQRNLLNNTDTFSGWLLEGGTLTGGFTDPQGGTTAYKYVRTAGGGLWANQGFTLAATTYTQSIWVKSVSGANVTFDLGSGSGIVGQVNLTATATWQRVSNTNTFNAGVSFYLYNISDTVNGIYIWHPQMELGNLTDYQVTINAQEQFAAAYKYNLKDPQDTDAAFRLKIFGTWTFSPTGAKPNGTNAYMDTALNLLSNYSNVLSNHFSVYYRTGDTSNEKIGAHNGSMFDQGMSAHLNWFGNYYNDNMGRTNLDSATYGTSNAMHLSSVTLPNTQKMYRNGVLRINGVTSNSSYPSLNFYFSANNNGTANSFSSRELAIASIGDGLTDTEAAAFYTIVQQFQTSLNRQINP